MTTEVPDCTLPTVERPVRLAEFDAVFATARRVERISSGHVRMLLAGDATLAATVVDLTEREARCCSFFTFTVTPADGASLTLDIVVPARYTDVVDALAARAAEVSGRAS